MIKRNKQTKILSKIKIRLLVTNDECPKCIIIITTSIPCFFSFSQCFFSHFLFLVLLFSILCFLCCSSATSSNLTFILMPFIVEAKFCLHLSRSRSRRTWRWKTTRISLWTTRATRKFTDSYLQRIFYPRISRTKQNESTCKHTCKKILTIKKI